MGFLLLSLLFSIAGSISVKQSAGFQKIIPGVTSSIFFGLCIYYLTLAVDTVETGIAYAICSGVSIADTTFAGILFFTKKQATVNFFRSP